ncbi:tetratricopeptide repeat protein [Marinomonas sp. IMCC 4694]|uniref:tetratricopeptide repeat protein n=1 Tax=Marinomonas sp. IMCC 4694 TaxID=2605432 RepID=UPI0011E7E70F|nr:tetratricopeptide repeat protein [Marinomonas sp. IMCC 4694]TYL48467.1 tetratricopeptide repeat protein [Marinomonas sp. IMCC 4694]
MIMAYCVMVLLIVLSVVYLYWYVSSRFIHNTDRDRHAFATIRRNEIAQEETAGRLTLAEASQLLQDLEHEVRSSDQHRHRRFSNQIVLARWVMLSGSIVVVLGSVSLYHWLGYAKEVVFTQQLQVQQLTPEKITEFLQYRSKRYDGAEDWYYLASDHLNAGRYQDAVIAFERAIETLPEQAEGRVKLLVEYAQAIFYANGNKSSAKMRQVVDAVLQIAPHQATALDLKGVAEFTEQRYLGAILAWQEAIRYSAGSGERLALLSAINAARQRGNIGYQQVPPIITDQLAVQIEWDETTLKWQPDDVLLVYAVIKEQKMPVAIQRVFPRDLSQPILLTNLDALMPTITLADAESVDVVVKLANINDKDLTKGQIIGSKRGLLINYNEIFRINVAL